MLAKIAGKTIVSMVWWVRFKLTIRGRRARAGENSSPENVCEHGPAALQPG